MDLDNYKSIVAENIKDARLRAGLSQEELAQKLNAHVPQISRWESGKHSIDLYTAFWLSRVLNVSMDKLFGGK